MTIFYLCLLVLVSLYLLSNVIEPYEYETKFTQNDLKFIPYSSSPETNALNNYVIRAVKLKKPYLLSSILDANRNYNTHSVFEFPTNDPRKSVHVIDFDIGKDYPLPIIDNKLETKNARDKIWRVKSSAQSKILARDLLKKHTSSSPNKFKVA